MRIDDQRGFKDGHDFAHERAKILEEALEHYANKQIAGEQARAALAEWMGW